MRKSLFSAWFTRLGFRSTGACSPVRDAHDISAIHIPVRDAPTANLAAIIPTGEVLPTQVGEIDIIQQKTVTKTILLRYL